MGGTWPSTPEKPAPTGCNAYASSAVWDADLVRDDLRSYILEHLGDQEAILVIDAHEFPQARQKVGGGQTAVLWDDWQGGKLSGWRLSQLREFEGTHPYRS